MSKQIIDAIESNNKEHPSINAEAVRGLAELLNETGLTEIEYEAHGCRIRVGKNISFSSVPVGAPGHPTALASVPPTPVESSSTSVDYSTHPGAVLAPMVGTIYTCPKPDASPFVKVGDIVKKDDTLVIIEAMKVMNPIRAPKAGTISKILVENTMPVEYGQILFVIE